MEKAIAGLCAPRGLSIPAAPALAGSFGPDNSKKGPGDAGANCHPPGQTVDEPACK